MQKFFDDFVAFRRNFFALQEYELNFHQYCGIMGSISQIYEELWVPNLNQNRTSPSKPGLVSYPGNEVSNFSHYKTGQ